MELINWNVIYSENDFEGRYTHQIKWEPPKKSGFIVQYIELEDPIKMTITYNGPYYEAWKVEDGLIVHDTEGPKNYDDSFSNEEGGVFQLTKQLAIDGTQYSMKKAGVDNTYVKFICTVYWVDKDSATYAIIDKWKRGYEEGGVQMAHNLRSSYNNPGGLECGINREYTAYFISQ